MLWTCGGGGGGKSHYLMIDDMRLPKEIGEKICIKTLDI